MFKTKHGLQNKELFKAVTGEDDRSLQGCHNISYSMLFIYK